MSLEATQPPALPHAPDLEGPTVRKPPPPRWLAWVPGIGLMFLLANLAVAAFLYVTQGAAIAGKFLLAGVQLFAFGKEGSIPVGLYILELDAKLVATAIILTDLAFVLLTYPLFHLAFEAIAKKRGIFGAILRDARVRAAKHQKTVARWGIAALGLFMLLPGPMSSPPVAIVLGRLAGLRALPVIFVICGAIVVTTAVWTTFYLVIGQEVEKFDDRIPLAFTLALTTIILGHTLYSGMRSHRREKAAEAALATAPERP